MDIEEIGFESEDEDPDNRADSAAMSLVKQMITLSAGVLALSGTFLEKINSLPLLLMLVLALAWLALILSVFGGIQTLSIIVKSRLNRDDNWSKHAGKRFAQLAKYGFLVGIGLFAIFAFCLFCTINSIPNHSTPSEQSHSHQAARKSIAE
jgi:hypothetical protein